MRKPMISIDIESSFMDDDSFYDENIDGDAASMVPELEEMNLEEDIGEEMTYLVWSPFDWKNEETYPPDDTPILVRFTEGKKQVRNQAVVVFNQSGMFGPRFDFRHSASLIEQDNRALIQVHFWSVLPLW